MSLPGVPKLSQLNPLNIFSAAVNLFTGGQAQPKDGNPDPQTLTRTVMIILGLLLIAAGIFSFDKTKTFITQGARAGAEAVAA